MKTLLKVGFPGFRYTGETLHFDARTMEEIVSQIFIQFERSMRLQVHQ